MGISTSFAMISVIQMRADQLQKEFQEHQRRTSNDRMVSTEKGGNGGDRNSLRGKLYDKYMEKRVARLRMEQGSKRAAMNEAKLRALRDDLERCRMEFQGMVVSSKDVGLGARQRLQSINVWSSQMTEELRQIDILRPEEDDDLTKYFCQREKMESRASARDELLPISRSHKPRKASLVRNRPSSSSARPIVLPVPGPSNKLTRSSSKPENLLQLRKVNAKPPPVISRKTNHSIARSSVQTRNASEDLQKSRSSLKKSSTIPLGYRKTTKGKVKELKKGSQSFDERYRMSFKSEYLTRKANPRTFVFEPRDNKSHGSLSFHADNVENKANVDVLAMRLDEEESNRDLLENFSKSIDLDPFTRNTSATNSGKTTSFKLEKEQDFGNLTVGIGAGYSGKVSSYVMRNAENIGVGHSTVATEGPNDSATEKAHEDCFGVNVVNPKSSQESDDSGNFESTDDDSSRLLSCVELSMNFTSELPNSSLVKNFEVFGTKSLNQIPTTCETAPAAGDVKSLEANTNRIRRKIRNPPKSVPPAAKCSYGRSQTGISKGFKRLSKLCKMSRGNESSADWASTTTSKGDKEIFTKSLVLEEQGSIIRYDAISSAKQNLPIVTECVRLNRFFSIAVPLLHFSILSPLERIKQKGGYVSGRSLKATGSFLTLSSLGCRRDDTNPRHPIPQERIPR